MAGGHALSSDNESFVMGNTPLQPSTLLLVQPSSASPERVYGLLSTLTAQQESALEDYIEAGIRDDQVQQLPEKALG